MMSGYAGGSSDNKGLDSLLAQLRQSNKPINLEPSSGYGYTSMGANANAGYFGQPAQPVLQYTGPSSYHQPTVSSAAPTPPAFNNSAPHHLSAIMSPASTPHGHPQSNPMSHPRASAPTNLLNLLKFSGGSSAPAQKPPAPIGTPLLPSREPSMTFPRSEIVGQVSADHGQTGSELLAALMGGSVQSPQMQQRASSQVPAASQSTKFSSSAAPTSPPADTQNYLLSLLNKPKTSESDFTPHLTPASTSTSVKRERPEEDEIEVSELENTADEEAAFNPSLKSFAATEGMANAFGGKENTSLGALAVKDSSKASSKSTAHGPTPNAPQGRFTYTNPFDELAASSPLVRTPKNATPTPTSAVTAAPAPAMQILKRQGEGSESNKRKVDARSSTSSASPVPSKRKVYESPAISGPPTPAPAKETVSDALNHVGEKVDKQVQEAIVRAENDAITKEYADMMTAKTNEDFEESAQILAKHVKTELVKEKNAHALDVLPASQAAKVEAIVNAVADGNLADVEDIGDGNVVDSWESADADEMTIKEEAAPVVKVYNFPMRPWTSITINESEGAPVFRDDILMDIARLKKDFDQIDRNLVTASSHIIVYGMSKNGGIRIIRQEDGKDGRLFTETHDRIFNVVISSSSADLKESILGTGVSGTVYWALIKDGEGDNLDDGNLEMHGFALPPSKPLDGDSPSGSSLKTRARKSSSHPDFFAIGRGKFIHIIWPSIVMRSYLKNGKDRKADTEKYLLENSFAVNTDKTGKDFVFSEDDTIIASLDKAGRVKFWDVRRLTETDGRGNPSADNKQPIEIKDPVCTFVTTPASEKSWPTSVLFVDKYRPYQKGGALRYVIVGMKQNHTLQLWDLGLQKSVQEIHLPHNKESDAVCSVLYHAPTGIIAIGHPTRNSIYLLHLSAPKYNLPKSLTQAEYMHKLVEKDPYIPKPEATAVISGMREYSFENRGSLRSLDILANPASSIPKVGEPVTMFELYAMHSKGVTCITVKQAELGWTEDNKVINPVAAEEASRITIDVLKDMVPVVEEPVLMRGDIELPIRSAAPRAKELQETPKKTHQAEASTSGLKADAKSDGKDSVSNGAINSGAEKSGKRKPKKGRATSEAPALTPTPPQPSQSSKTIVLDPNSHARNGAVPKTIPESSNFTQSKVNFPVVSASTSDVTAKDLKDLERRLTEEVKKAMITSSESLLRDIRAERRTRDSLTQANHESLLQIVSATLADNVEGSLSRIVASTIQGSVVPAIRDVTLKAVRERVDEQLGSKLATQLQTTIPKELQRLLPDAIGRSLQNPQVLKLVAESLAKTVAYKTEEHYVVLMQNTLFPSFTNMARQAVDRATANIQQQATAQIEGLKQQRNENTAKIEQLMGLVGSLTETITTMAQSQAAFQAEFLKIQSSAATSSKYKEDTRQSNSSSDNKALAVADEESEEDSEYEAQLAIVRAHMEAQHYSDAVLAWLQSGYVQEMYKAYLASFRPEFLRELNTIMLLSVGSQICEEIEDDFMTPRVAYLDMVIGCLLNQALSGTLQEEALSHIPSICATFIQRLEHLFMLISNVNAQDQGLKELQRMVTTSKRIIEASQSVSSPSSRLTSSMRSVPSRHY